MKKLKRISEEYPELIMREDMLWSKTPHYRLILGSIDGLPIGYEESENHWDRVIHFMDDIGEVRLTLPYDMSEDRMLEEMRRMDSRRKGGAAKFFASEVAKHTAERKTIQETRREEWKKDIYRDSHWKQPVQFNLGGK